MWKRQPCWHRGGREGLREDKCAAWGPPGCGEGQEEQLQGTRGGEEERPPRIVAMVRTDIFLCCRFRSHTPFQPFCPFS